MENNFLRCNLGSESIIPPSQVYFGFCLTFSPQWTRDRSRCWLCSMWVAAFDTVDHSILLDRLSISFGLTGSAFDWMRSFIVGRTQTVLYCGSVSRCAVVRSGVAQGSVLGPLLYVLYTADIQRLVVSLGFDVHLYADDTQFHGSCMPADTADLAALSMDVINAVKTWMSSNRLRLNADETQFIWLGTSHFLGKRDMQAVSSILQSSDVVNNLGVYLDSGLVMDRQMSKLCQVCYFHLRRLRNSASIAHQGIATHVSPRLRYESGRSLRVVHGSDGPAGRVGSGRVTILPDFGGSGRVGSALQIF